MQLLSENRDTHFLDLVYIACEYFRSEEYIEWVSSQPLQVVSSCKGPFVSGKLKRAHTCDVNDSSFQVGCWTYILTSAVSQTGVDMDYI